MRTLAVIATFLAPFFFPIFFSAFIILVAAVIVPPLALFGGLLLDALYMSPHGFPYATLVGLLGTVIAYVVHDFLKTRIMR